MLTSDLLRIRIKEDAIEPRLIDTRRKKFVEKAEKLIELYREHLNRPRGELEESIRYVIGDGTDYLVQRGLAKLLSDRSEFEVLSPVDPRELRRAIFEKMAQHHPVPLKQEPQYPLERSALLTEIGEQFEMSLEQVEHALYSDLQDAYVMTDFKDTNPQALLERYNLAQAQALLFRATHLRLELWDTSAQRLRQLVRYIKFYQLISWIQPLASQRYRIELDGPMSLFRFCQKYGLQMANFLPALLLCENWSMEAEIQWEDKRKKLTFKLDHETDLQSHYPDKGVYVTGEELHFRKQWKKKNKTQWSLEPKARTLRLGSQDVLVTDYTLSHEDGREAEIYIVGFWQRQTLIRKLELIEEHAPPNVIVLAPARLRASQDDLDSISDRLLFYKQVIPTKKVVALAEEHAIIPD